MFKLILFDLGGVLFTNGSNEFINRLAQRYQKTVSEIKTVIDGEIGTAYREGKINRDYFWQEVITKLNLREPAHILEKQWISSYQLIEATKTIILSLRKKYKVFYLSDNVKERVEGLERKFRFLNWFDGGIFSHEVGVRKPNPKIYSLVLKKAGFKAPETVFIDDKKSSLMPAKQMGMTTILFESPKQLLLALNKNRITSITPPGCD